MVGLLMWYHIYSNHYFYKNYYSLKLNNENADHLEDDNGNFKSEYPYEKSKISIWLY